MNADIQKKGCGKFIMMQSGEEIYCGSEYTINYDIALCDYCEGYAKAKEEVLNEIIKSLENKEGCPYCAIPLMESHFCRRCNDRVIVGSSYEGFIYWLESISNHSLDVQGLPTQKGMGSEVDNDSPPDTNNQEEIDKLNSQYQTEDESKDLEEYNQEVSK